MRLSKLPGLYDKKRESHGCKLHTKYMPSLGQMVVQKHGAKLGREGIKLVICMLLRTHF